MKVPVLALCACFAAAYAVPQTPVKDSMPKATMPAAAAESRAQAADDVSALIAGIEAELAGTEADVLFATAVVYPELLRYWQWRDTMESALDRMLVCMGWELECCSIGPLQMKPSFAQAVEKEISRSPVLKQKYAVLLPSAEPGSFAGLTERVNRLKYLHWECLYLRAFLEICGQRHGLAGKSDLYRLEISAAAYNAGFMLPLQQLEKLRGLDYVKKVSAYWSSRALSR